jgi:ATP-dependent DNA helicase RecG
MNDLDFDKVRLFITKVNNSGRFILPEKAEDALNKLRLVVKNVPVNAAMLLFAKEGLNHNVHVGRFKTPSMIIDDKIYRGGLFEVVEETMRYIIGQIKVAFEIAGTTTKRTEIFEYPIPALRELVLNAIIHRDYTSPVDIQIHPVRYN